MPESTLTRPNTRQLDPFVGAWKMTGHAHESPFGPDAEVAADETFEWLTGRQFLMHRLKGQLGDEGIGCVEVLGRESGGDAFTAHTFYNDGTSTRWNLEEHDGAWIMSGQWPKGREVFKVRCTITFDGRAHRRNLWEYSTDDSGWHVFWETNATRKPRK
jgi:hypothetical protein